MAYWNEMIVGIDEVGRGPWAGPLVVGAVVLPENCTIEGLTDSKKLTSKRRELLEPQIKAAALSYGLGWVHADELDEVGMSEALRRATVRAMEQISVPYHEIIIDGTINFLAHTGKGKFVTMLPKADALIPAVSAASVLAKVARDRFMAEQDNLFPGYAFAKHAGYGTAAHRQAIADLGVSPLHRLSFAPLKVYEQERPDPPISTVGQRAEQAVADYLTTKGYKVLERNWRTRFCEIDIIAIKSGAIYIIEVKHRKDDRAGGGLAAITLQKQHKMRLGALSYQARHYPHGTPMRLVVVTTAGQNPTVTDYLELE